MFHGRELLRHLRRRKFNRSEQATHSVTLCEQSSCHENKLFYPGDESHVCPVDLQ